MSKFFDDIMEGLEEARAHIRGEAVDVRETRWSEEDGCWLATQRGVTAHGDTVGEAHRELDVALALKEEHTAT